MSQMFKACLGKINTDGLFRLQLVIIPITSPDMSGIGGVVLSVGYLVLSGTTLGSITKMGTGSETFSPPRNVEEVCMFNMGKKT